MIAHALTENRPRFPGMQEKPVAQQHSCRYLIQKGGPEALTLGRMKRNVAQYFM